jgi:hypothetical protein
MPLGEGVRYRFRNVKGGKQRLAFRGAKKVVEVKSYTKGGKPKGPAKTVLGR